MIGMDMTGKVTLVTGAGGGIGGGIADVFAAAGSLVYVADMELDDARARAAQITARGLTARAVRLDVTQKDEINALMDQIVKENGKIDHLINCAGIGQLGMFTRTPDSDEITARSREDAFEVIAKEYRRRTAEAQQAQFLDHFRANGTRRAARAN